MNLYAEARCSGRCATCVQQHSHSTSIAFVQFEEDEKRKQMKTNNEPILFAVRSCCFCLTYCRCLKYHCFALLCFRRRKLQVGNHKFVVVVHCYWLYVYDECSIRPPVTAMPGKYKKAYVALLTHIHMHNRARTHTHSTAQHMIVSVCSFSEWRADAIGPIQMAIQMHTVQTNYMHSHMHMQTRTIAAQAKTCLVPNIKQPTIISVFKYAYHENNHVHFSLAAHSVGPVWFPFHCLFVSFRLIFFLFRVI